MKSIRKIFTYVFFSALSLSFPFLSAYAFGPNDSIVPCSGVDCHFSSFIQLFENIINFLLLIAIPIAALSFLYAGFLYVTAAGNPGKVEEAHGIFKSVVIGVIFMLAAWLLINTILAGLGLSDNTIFQGFLKR